MGVATATSLTFSPTTGGIVGTTTNNNTTAGDVGEFVSSVIPLASAVSAANGTWINVTSISLTAGDWDVWGNVTISNNSTGLTAGSAWTSIVSATQPDISLISFISVITASTLGQNAPNLRYSLASTTTIFLSAEAFFSAGTSTACGGIYARRRR
ncbi:MAG TPA: hypothetical protein VHZ76_07255 [Gammaproteobacteria bacterium]|nr:hypothetical protein [Gammaproteobacteria bacterium]